MPRRHFVVRVLAFEDQATIAVLQGFQQQAGSESCLSHPSWTDEDDILGTRNELQFGKFLDLATRDARLFLERKRLQGPLLRQSRLLDAVLQTFFLAFMPLCLQQSKKELAVRG